MAFAAGWLASVGRVSVNRESASGRTLSRASLTGMLTTLIACVAAVNVSRGALLWPVAAMFFAVSILPSALFASIGVALANRLRGGKPTAEPGAIRLLLNGALPLLAVLVWPVGYFVGKAMVKPAVAIVSSARKPVVIEAPKPPPPRYAPVAGFADANAWKRAVVKLDVVEGRVTWTAVALSRLENRVALVARLRDGRLAAVSRHLLDSAKDREIAIDAELRLMAWSLDDERMIALDADGKFVVLDWMRGAAIPLPIPKVDARAVTALAWWQAEDVVVAFRQGETKMLSLDTLRLIQADEREAWAKLDEAARAAVLRKQSLHEGAKVAYCLQAEGALERLVAQDAEAIYSRVLSSGMENVHDTFSNRDGSIAFVAQPDRLRVLYMGLRDAPTLRFAAEARDTFPSGEAAESALKNRAIECVVVPPIVNPLNGRTVSGDVERTKGLARIIAVDGKTATVWVSEERAPIHEGDVVMLPRAPLPKGDALLSPTWFAVLTIADASQDIPRREVEKPAAANERAKPDSPPPSSRIAPVSNQPAAKSPVSPPKKSNPAPPPTFASKVSPLPSNASPQDRVKHFIETHHAKISDRNIDGIVADYGAVVNFGGKEDVSRDAIRQHEQSTLASVASLVETVDDPIAVTPQQNNRYHAEYGITFEMINRDGTGGQGSALIEMDVLLTSAGPKIVAKKTRVYKKGPVKKR